MRLLVFCLEVLPLRLILGLSFGKEEKKPKQDGEEVWNKEA